MTTPTPAQAMRAAREMSDAIKAYRKWQTGHITNGPSGGAYFTRIWMAMKEFDRAIPQPGRRRTMASDPKLIYAAEDWKSGFEVGLYWPKEKGYGSMKKCSGIAEAKQQVLHLARQGYGTGENEIRIIRTWHRITKISVEPKDSTNAR